MVESWIDVIAEQVEEVERFISKQLHSDNPELDEMCHYVVQAGGKRVRPIVCILAHMACGGTDTSRAISVGSAFEIVHSATLVHDDINDNGELRRGRKTLHKQYTITKAIVAGDFMLIRGYHALGEMGPEVVEVIVKAASMMSESEFLQKDLEHDVDASEKEYFEIINGKTAMLINASAMAGAYIATKDTQYITAIDTYSIKIGLAFQIIDDVLDIVGSVKDTGKKVGIDIMEGKPTLPMIYAMKDKTYGPELQALFKKDVATDVDIARALEIIKLTDSIEQCRHKAESIVEEAIEELKPLPDSKYKDSLAGLARYIVSRDR